MAIANDPALTAPLRAILATLARHGETTGIGPILLPTRSSSAVGP